MNDPIILSLAVADPPGEQNSPLLASPDQADTRLHMVENAGWTVALFLSLALGFRIWSVSWSLPIAIPAGLGVMTLSTFGIWRCWAQDAPLDRWLRHLLLASVLMGTLIYSAVDIALSSGYGTDASAFNEYAAQQLLKGTNPYSVPMTPALAAFDVRIGTMTFDGSSIVNLSYPAGSFLVYVPAVALGLAEAANITGVLLWLGTVTLLYLVLPARLCWLAVALGAMGDFGHQAAGGGTDVIFFPLLVLAVWRWDRFGETNAPLATWAGPAALGLACSMKQTPWFLVPFLIAGVALAAKIRGDRQIRVVAAYVATAILPFLMLNLPFALWDFRGWLRGVLTPFMGTMVPDGQGLVSLATFGYVGGGRLSVLTPAAGLFYLAALLWFIFNYPRSARGWLPLLPLVFLVPSRSLGTYVIMWVPAILVAATSVRSTGKASHWTGTKKLVFAGPIVLGVGLLIIAATAAPPLRIAVVNAESSNGRRVTSIDILVTNRTQRELRPVFTVNLSNQPTGLWAPRENQPLLLEPGATARLTLVPDNRASNPRLTSTWFVEAFTTEPKAVSVSAWYRPPPQSD